MINTILRFDTGNELNSRRMVFDLWGEDIFAALKTPGKMGRSGTVYGELLYTSDRTAREMIARLADGMSPEAVVNDLFQCPLPGGGAGPSPANPLPPWCGEIDGRMAASDETGALLNAMAGGHVPAGTVRVSLPGPLRHFAHRPKFLQCRSHPHPHPGRPGGWGSGLADALLERHFKEEGRYPESRGYGLAGCGYHAGRR